MIFIKVVNKSAPSWRKHYVPAEVKSNTNKQIKCKSVHCFQQERIGPQKIKLII